MEKLYRHSWCSLIIELKAFWCKLVFTLFSLCLLLQNQTLTTSFSRLSPSAILIISWEEGLLCSPKCLSRASLAAILEQKVKISPLKSFLHIQAFTTSSREKSSNSTEGSDLICFNFFYINETQSTKKKVLCSSLLTSAAWHCTEFRHGVIKRQK